uniref:Velvet domain-containing protein n=1 Tax=Panagrellus redivivus TaxID=6233 RepID=A0A7E4V6K9_PANRE
MHQEFEKVIFNRIPNSDGKTVEPEPELIAVGRLVVKYTAPSVTIEIIAKDGKTVLVDEIITTRYRYEEDYERGIAFFDVFKWSKVCTISLQFGKSESLDVFLKFVEQYLTNCDSDLIYGITKAKAERVEARVLVPVTRDLHGASGTGSGSYSVLSEAPEPDPAPDLDLRSLRLRSLGSGSFGSGSLLKIRVFSPELTSLPVTREDVKKESYRDDDELEELFQVEQELRHEVAATPIQTESPKNYEDVPYEPEEPLHKPEAPFREPEAPQDHDEEIFYEAEPTHHHDEEPTLHHDEEIPPYKPETLLYHEHDITEPQEPALYRDRDFGGDNFTPPLTEERKNIAHPKVDERHYEPFPEEHPETPAEVKLLPPSDENDDAVSSPPPSEADEQGTHVGILRSDSFETGSSASYVIIKHRGGHYEDSD